MLKIVSARVIVTCPGRNFVTLKIETGDGVTGLGDATLNGRELAVATYLGDHVIPCLIGRDAHQIEDIWQTTFTSGYWRTGPIHNVALAGVDIALWDIKGKAEGKPVSELLGGAKRDRVRAYASMLMPDTPEETAERVGALCNDGFTAVKLGWGKLAGEFVEAKRRPGDLAEYIQQVLAETWEANRNREPWEVIVERATGSPW